MSTPTCRMHRRAAFLGAVSAPALAVGGFLSGFVVHDRPPPSSGALGLISRTTVTSGGFPYTFRRVADDFVPTSPGYLSGIEWWGGMETSAGSLSNVQSFTFEIFASAAGTGLPATSVYATTLPLNSTNPQLVAPPQVVGLLNAPMYHFTTPDLTSALVQISQGQTYWLSVSANLIIPPDATHEAWAWSSGTNPDANQLICQDRFDGQNFQLRTLSARNAAFRVWLTIGAPPECFGDANFDRSVDAADLSILLANFGTLGNLERGNFNDDSQVDAADLSILLANFGKSCA